MEQTLYELRKEFVEKFSRSQTILDQAIFRWLRESQNLDIRDRVDFNELEDVLTRTFEHNGITLPFQFEIIDTHNNIIYRSISQRSTTTIKNGQQVYCQRFFLWKTTGKTRRTYMCSFQHA